MPFVDTNGLKVIERLPGWKGRYFHSASMTFAHYEFAAGSSIHEHFHPEEGVYEVIEGELELTIDSFFDAGQNPGYQNEFDRSLDRSVLGSDFPHRVVLSAVYDLPFGRGHRLGSGMSKWMDAIVGGWQTNGIFTYQSGQPLNFGVSGQPAYAGNRARYTNAAQAQTDGGITDRLGGVSGGPGYLNAAAFRVPLLFEFGNTPRLDSRNRAPANINLDFSLIKNFLLTERTNCSRAARHLTSPIHPCSGFRIPQWAIRGSASLAASQISRAICKSR